MKINVVTNEGVLVGQIDLDEYDLSKSIAQWAVMAEIMELVEEGAVEEGSIARYSPPETDVIQYSSRAVDPNDGAPGTDGYFSFRD